MPCKNAFSPARNKRVRKLCFWTVGVVFFVWSRPRRVSVYVLPSLLAECCIIQDQPPILTSPAHFQDIVLGQQHASSTTPRTYLCGDRQRRRIRLPASRLPRPLSNIQCARESRMSAAATRLRVSVSRIRQHRDSYRTSSDEAVEVAITLHFKKLGGPISSRASSVQSGDLEARCASHTMNNTRFRDCDDAALFICSWPAYIWLLLVSSIKRTASIGFLRGSGVMWQDHTR